MKKHMILLWMGMAWIGGAAAQTLQLSDANATPATVNLYRNLHRTAQKGFLFGHQDDLAYGVNWRYQKGRSDVKEVTGDYPALYGWDLGNIELPGNANNLDGVPFASIKKFIKENYQRGGVNTISWHLNNPLSGKNAWDTTKGTVASILPGGSNHETYKQWLDMVADFLAALKDDKGQPIPILFRPFHELTGTWFWWGTNCCTAEEFKTLWRFTVYYLQTVRQLHHLIYVYNTSDFKNPEAFLERYPGDDVADVLSFDSYQYNDPQKDDWFQRNVSRELAEVDSIAKSSNKLMAFGETGYEAIPYASWWTGTLMQAINHHPIAYVLLWRNHGLASWNNKMHYYVPYKGQVSELDFIKFYNLPETLFEKEAAAEKLYQP